MNISPSYSIREDPGMEGKDQTLHKMASMAPVQETANMGPNGRYTTRYTWAGSAADESGRLDYIGNSYLFRTIASTYFEVEILKGLVAKSTFNFDNADNVAKGYTPSGVLASIRGTYSSYRKQNFVNENTLSYTKSFKNVHNFNALAGYSYNNYKIDKVSLASGALYTNYTNTTLPAQSTGSTNEQRAVLLSYYGRLQYDYAGKYLLSASMRRDGSSRFGSQHRWGAFPSASVGWRISDEKFFKVKFINDLKIRASYGAGGNNAIPNYASYASLVAYNYGLGGGVQLGTGISGINNPDLHWESSYTNNIGLDASFLNNRITTSFDYYVKTNKDLLLYKPSLATSGSTTFLTNIGEVRNKGFEIEVSTKNIVDKNFQWNTSLNLSNNENRVMKLDGEQTRMEIATNSFGNVPFILMEVGRPMNSIYVVKQNGVLTQEDIDKGYPVITNQKAGDPRYVDFNGDGKITQADRQVLGQPSPKYTFGITNTFKYKNFDLTVLVQGQTGGHIYSLFGRAMNLTGMSVTQNALDVDVKTRGNYYTNFNSIVNSDWLYKSDYVSVRSINLGFNLKSLIKSDFVSAARIYLSGDNLFYKDKYAGGYNPEATNINLSGETNFPVPGDYGGLPVAKSFVLGVNFTF
ncbi:MAG: SusC/RagA family TonB-linked outer membrane protein [Chitinophagaceae bacterium]|nr:MAG: SusC/RagA family TonB-linked outer membrane protein [Chitinophagaceae bacterium]